MNNEQPVTNTAPDDEIDLRELIITIAKGWRIILISTVLVTVLAGIFAITRKDQYVVTTKAATLGGSSGNSQMAGLAALAGVQMNSGGSDVDLLQHIDVVIKNTYFMDNLLKKEWSIPRKQTPKEIKAKTPVIYDTLTLAEYWEIPEPDKSIPDWEYSYTMGLYGKLRSPKPGYMSVSNTSGILEVKTKFDNPFLAYQFHLELIRLLKEYFAEDYSTKDRESRVFIQKRVGEVKSTLTGAEAQLKALRQANLIATAPRIVMEQARLEREIALQSGLYAELTKQLEMAKIEEKKETPVFEILQPAERPLGPSEPNRKLLIVIGFVLGGALGVFIVFLKEWIKTFFNQPKPANS